MTDLNEIKGVPVEAYGYWGKAKAWVASHPGYSLTIGLVELIAIIALAAR